MRVVQPAWGSLDTLGLLLCVGGGFLISFLVVRRLASGNTRLRVLDEPNERSLHSTPVSRIGGLGIIVSIASAWGGILAIEGFPKGMAGVLIGAFTVVGVSLWDDYRGLGPGYRIISHALAALAAVGGGLELGSLAFLDLRLPLDGWLGKVMLVIFITWTINLYNFMDGMDGLAGSMGVVGFSCLGIIGFCIGESVLPWLALSIAAASGGFLVLNYPPARIFMGDGGASTLGFLAGVLIVWGNGLNAVPLWAGLLVFSPFLIDATYTLMRRILRGERVWEAHKTHLYQLLVDRVGWSHGRTLAWETALMLACGFSGLVGSCFTPELLEWWIGFWVCVYLGLVLGLRGYIRRRAA